MTDAIYRIMLLTGPRLARGTVEAGPQELLAPNLTLGQLLAMGGPGLGDAASMDSAGACPAGMPLLAPVDEQDVWCSGVTYERTREARVGTLPQAAPYEHLYTADRPELFFKADGRRVRGPGEPVGIRADSAWDMAEPELGLVIAADGQVAGYVVGNDLTSRDIERQNPLYLPQAKVYEGSCALGPAIVPLGAAEPPFEIGMVIRRDDRIVFEGHTGTACMVRSFADLAAWLCRALRFPSGVVLLTGCGIVPDAELSLRAGDRVRIDVPPLGVLENGVEVVGVGEPAPRSAAIGAEGPP